MSKDGKTITKGRHTTKSPNEAAAIQEMGNRLCGPYQTLGKDGCTLHHHRDGVPNTMGRGAASQGLHGCYGCKVFVRKRVDMIWLSENLNE